MYKKIVGIIIFIFMILSVYTSTASIDITKMSQLKEDTLSSSAAVDDWPMFHHDLGHSGYSTSTAPSSNHVLWSYTTGLPILSSPAVVSGKVYIGSYDSKLYCLDAITGAWIWDYTTGGYLFSSPAIYNGKVYVGSQDQKVYCLNADTGTWIWDYTTEGAGFSSPAIYNGKVYIGSSDTNVYCLNADTGTLIWDYTIGHAFSSPAIYNGKVYIGSYDDKVYCFNADTGAWIWEYTTGDNIESSPAVYNGKVYIGSLDQKVYCLNAETGAWIWDYTTDGWVDSSPAIYNGKVYVGSWDFKVYCLNADTGAWIWDYTTGIVQLSSPAIANGKVYVGSNEYKVYCLNANTGTLIWDYTTANTVFSSPAIANGKVYVGSQDRKVYCFGSATSNSPPTVEITYPTSEDTVSGTITITGTASDPDGPSDLKEVQVDTGFGFKKATGTTSWSYIWNTSEVENGEHTIFAIAYDKQLAYSIIEHVTVNVNNHQNQPPNVNILSPYESDIVTGIVCIYGCASDPDGNETLTRVEVKIDDKTWQNATGTEYWNYSWNTIMEIDGIHTLCARSYDGKLYSDYSFVNVTVLNAKPEIIISGINGGLGVSADIKNIGTTLVTNVSWSIDIEEDFAFILSGKHTDGVFGEIVVNETETIQTDGLRGIGFITITVQAADAVKTATAFLLGPLVLRINEI